MSDEKTTWQDAGGALLAVSFCAVIAIGLFGGVHHFLMMTGVIK